MSAQPGADGNGRVVRIANCSGFWGDRLAAAQEMVDGGPIDVLTGDYLAELTMLLLARRQANGGQGFVPTALRQAEEVLGRCVERGVRIVSNAGGLDPAGLAGELRRLAGRLGIRCRVAHVEGDDLRARIGDLRKSGEELTNLDTGEAFCRMPGSVLTANAYLGGWGITEALRDGADVVVTGRVTDAALTLGPSAWWHGWHRADYDKLAGAVVAGHVLECGAQATGGNFSGFLDGPPPMRPGFPLAEVAADGSAVITKHPGTGGRVTRATVTAQLLYEIGDPAYLNPDVTTHFDTVVIEDAGPDRVRLHGTLGSAPPGSHKVCITAEGGWHNHVTFVLTGLHQREKADLARAALFDRLGGEEQFALVRTTVHSPGVDSAGTEWQAAGRLVVAVRDPDRRKVGRRFSSAAVELALASYPGFFLTDPPRDATPVGLYWPALVSSEHIVATVVHGDGRRHAVAAGGEPTTGAPAAEAAGERVRAGRAQPAPPPPRWARRCTAPLGSVAYGRSGDKGAHANLGVWVDGEDAYRWLRSELDEARLRALLPEAGALTIRRYELPNLLAVNFVIEGLLGRGVADDARWDPQAKGLAEFVLSRTLPVPESLLRGPTTAAAVAMPPAGSRL